MSEKMKRLMLIYFLFSFSSFLKPFYLFILNMNSSLSIYLYFINSNSKFFNYLSRIPIHLIHKVINPF